ncbi:glycosyltransferase [Conexibacter stalactiti]|uniref:Glycosyltransferase n=1 Tax=Conexibacter stalactiti TaxID=1940611 RepID=A0ABU4HJM4_9ACTN|nr:glycosyltransferase [Conexibacter stalactiti]MDW5593511.1 glycosyltransferase [Conexibacter stalactiti]MEC5034152.1 glycosyltransferase [Conexibacter stalactiti]
MRITLVSDADLVNSNYRGYQPLMVLSRRGHDITFTRLGEPRYRASTLLQSDVVHIHRYTDPELLQIVAQLRDAGIGVVWDNDDDLTAVPRSNPNYRKFGGPANRARIQAALRRTVTAADVVTTPSELLAAQYRAAGADDVRLLENYLPPEFGRVKPAKHDGVTLVWLAGLEHQVDYQRLRLKETLVRLLDAHADLRVLSIGLGLGLPSDRYEHIRQVDFLELAKGMSAGDIGLAPLADIPWNQARSNIKLKEYAAAGLPWLASPVGPYLGLGEKQGGELVPDDAWHDVIDRLIVDVRRRRKLAKNAAKWAKGQSIEDHAHLWDSAFRDAAQRAKRRAL